MIYALTSFADGEVRPPAAILVCWSYYGSDSCPHNVSIDCLEIVSELEKFRKGKILTFQICSSRWFIPS
jgi:hypothetical protein